jgi:hypothetical protein
MVKFIFVCMAVTAFALISIPAQPLIGGILQARQQVEARNETAPSAPIASAEITSPETSPEDLNAVETAAGDASSSNHNFGAAFTDAAPKALQSPAEMPGDILQEPGLN